MKISNTSSFSITVPDVTIITVCKNAGSDLIRTCDSALGQVGIELQLIVQDGVSTDSSLSYIESLQDSRVHLISEPDSGIYDAMNRAFKHVQGKWCIYLNAGDSFYSNETLRTVLEKLKEREEADLVIFSFLNEFDKTITIYPQSITKYFLYRNGVNHQVQLWKTEVLKQYLPFNSQYKILADHHLLLRAFLSGVKIHSLRILGISYKDNGYSSQSQNQSLKENERKAILSELLDSNEIYFYDLLEFLLLKKIRLRFYRRFRINPLFRGYRKVINLINSVI